MELLPAAELERLRDAVMPQRQPCPWCGAVPHLAADGWCYGHDYQCPLWRQLPGDPGATS
jgi:hypothetical protein